MIHKPPALDNDVIVGPADHIPSSLPAGPSEALEPRIGCIASAMGIIGNKWTALILRDLASGPKRFGELEKSLRGGLSTTSISPRTLSQRLDDLQKHDIIAHHIYSDTPLRSEYCLTDKGQDLIPILKQMAVWGSKHYDGLAEDSAADC